MPQLPMVDLVLTDPPYGLGKKLHDGGTWSTAAKYDDMLVWDTKTQDKAISNILALNAHKIIWGGNYYDLPPSRCWLAWFKKNSVPTMADFELAWTSFDRPSKAFRGEIHPDGVNIHPTQKPKYLMVWCLTVSKVDGLTLDPFLGSGTTAVACERLKRQWIGIEIEEKYCEISAKRIEKERQQLSLFGNQCHDKPKAAEQIMLA
jgi:DNA modification methylase